MEATSMSLSPTKLKILETMLLNNGSAKASQIAKDAEAEFPSTMMHLLDLIRKGYASSPEKGQYIITDKGKEAIGIPETTTENAKAILAHTSHENAFHFYTAIEEPLNIYAYSLQNFLDDIKQIDPKSLEFHTFRGDFESWLICLGDIELAKKIALLKEKKLTGEELRRRLQSIIENRCAVLSALI